VEGALIVWRVDTWAEALHMKEIGAVTACQPLVHPRLPVMRAGSSTKKSTSGTSTWPCCAVRSLHSHVCYVNAKAVLLGESGVGKSGWASASPKADSALKLDTWRQFWHFPTSDSCAAAESAELTLWDLAARKTIA